jgi:hypothetical protein
LDEGPEQATRLPCQALKNCPASGSGFRRQTGSKQRFACGTAWRLCDHEPITHENKEHISHRANYVDAQPMSRRAAGIIVTSPQKNCLACATDPDESEFFDRPTHHRPWSVPRGLHQHLLLKSITVNLLFYKVFLKHIGCTPSPFHSS